MEREEVVRGGGEEGWRWRRGRERERVGEGGGGGGSGDCLRMKVHQGGESIILMR